MKIKLFGKTYYLRLTATTDPSNPSYWLLNALGSTPTSTGLSVTEENALQFSAVYACVRVISDQLSAFPKGIYRKIDQRTRERIDDSRTFLIDSEPNEFYSAFDFWDAINTSVLLWGNGFAKILRNGDFGIDALQFYHPTQIKIYYGPIDGKIILFYEDVETFERIPYYNMLHFKGLSYDGVQGQGVIRAFAKESIGLSVAAEKFGAKFFGNDTLMTKYLSHPTSLSEDAMKHIQESWQLANAGLDNAFKLKILEEGMKLENVGIPPDQAQFIGTRQHQVEEICRWFKVQPHLIQHLLRSTNNNIEHQGIEFVTQTLTPWVVRYEKELNRKLFTEEEKKTHYVKFNMGSLLRGDITARTAHYKTMYEIGVYSPNEIRELEDKNPRDGGDEYANQKVNPQQNPQQNEDKKDIRRTQDVTR